MGLCITTASVPGSLPEKLSAIALAGFHDISLSISDIVGFDGDLDFVAELISEFGLRVALIGPVEVWNSADPSSAIAGKAKLARRLGTDLLMIDMPEGLDLPNMRSDFSEMALAVGDGGARLAFRPGPASDANVLALIEDINFPHVGLALNSRDALSDGSKPARLRDVPSGRLFHVELADSYRADPKTPLWPGQGDLNLAGFVRVIGKSGYSGAWSVTGPLRPENAASDGYRALVNLLDDAAQSEPDLRFPIPKLPPRIYSSGYEFIEFAVDRTGAKTLTDMLTAMAFRMERRHVSKDVELWRQGAVNIVVNQDPRGHAHDALVAHGPTVCDMGLRVSDADATVKRAAVLGTPSFTQPVGLGELEIPAIRGVGGNIVHFIDENSDLHRVWDIEFDPVRKTQTTPPAGIRRIDHVAQTMKHDEMQSWLLYYISTFEMEKTALVDVADPSGPVHSQAIASPEGEVRLNLNGAEGRETFAGSFLADQVGAGVQHLAFLTDNIFETSDQLEVTGFPRLRISPNYYTETQAQFGLSDAMTEELHSKHILYDRDTAGEYFQLYSEPVFDGFFFEIVERRGRYQGYGARNAAVRLSAQVKFKQGVRADEARPQQERSKVEH